MREGERRGEKMNLKRCVHAPIGIVPPYQSSVNFDPNCISLFVDTEDDTCAADAAALAIAGATASVTMETETGAVTAVPAW